MALLWAGAQETRPGWEAASMPAQGPAEGHVSSADDQVLPSVNTHAASCASPLPDWKPRTSWTFVRTLVR